MHVKKCMIKSITLMINGLKYKIDVIVVNDATRITHCTIQYSI